jgi:cell division protein FtsB
MASRSLAPSRRATRQGRAAQSVSRRDPADASSRAPDARADAAVAPKRASRVSAGAPPAAGHTHRRRAAGKSPVELRPLRLVALALLLVAAALYVSPLRAFFAQQDRFDRQVASLSQAKEQNEALHTQIDRMRTRDFITRQAREQYQLVPPGLQAFVVKGLPGVGSKATSHGASGASSPAPSLLARLADLWRTIRE